MTPRMMKAIEKGGVQPPSAGRIGIIAGGGALPVEIAAKLADEGRPPFVVLVEGEVAAESALLGYEHAFIALEGFGDLVSLLKQNSVTQAVMAGTISRRPHWRSLRVNFALLAFLPKAVAALARGDDALLRAVIGHVESSGIKIVGAHEILPDLLAPEGIMTRAKPDARARRDIDAALAAARAIGALDIGQGAVAVGGRAIALEGIEGTDGLLERVRDLRSNGRIAANKGGVLVKCAKPGQELRADLPTIGVATVEGAHAAGLAGVAVESGRSLVLGYSEMVWRADALGLFVLGLPKQDGPE
jgi:DUF1009 family protein